MKWSFGASLLAHAALLAALIFLQPIALSGPSEERSVQVELITAAPPGSTAMTDRFGIDEATPSSALASEKIAEAARQSRERIRKAAEKPTASQDTDKAPKPQDLVVATKLYSDTLLAGTRNRSARAAMKTLAADERLIQLCDIEAIEQVRRAAPRLPPDYVIAYATADLKLSPNAVDAQGAAFLSRHNWYGLEFRCRVSADGSRVVAFAFLIGPAIPKTQWASHNLTTDADPDD